MQNTLWTTKDMLLHQSSLAFSEDDEMSLMQSIADVGEDCALWQPPGLETTIADIVWHVAWAKLWYMDQAFGDSPWSLEEPEGYQEKVKRLEQAHEGLMGCLETCSEEWLASPVPAKFHSDSGAHLFSILIIHDVSHAASIRVRRALYEQIN